MKFKGFAEFGLLLASFSYALEQMVESGEIKITANKDVKELTKEEETLDDIVKQFEHLVKETDYISSFTSPDPEDDIDEVTSDVISSVMSNIESEEAVDTEDLELVNELRKKILQAFEEKEAEVEETFNAASNSVGVVDGEFIPVTKDYSNLTEEQKTEIYRQELLDDFNEYIADIKNVYGKPSRITSTIDAMVEHTSIMENIRKLYPNLEDAFIHEYYRLKDAINSENPLNKEGVILHRLSFTDKEKLFTFCDKAISENIIINMDETKMIVDVIRPIVTKNGKVMAEIFKVANTAAAYGGFYEGYLVK